MDGLWFSMTILAALGCGVIGGVFFSFSTFVMGALARLPAAHGIAAMQSINIVVINPRFLGVFAGTALLGGVLAIVSVLVQARPGVAYVIAGALLYVIGTFAVTMVCNVPLNDALAALDPSAPDSARVWSDYLSRWTMWNHVRTAAAVAASAAFVLAACASR